MNTRNKLVLGAGAVLVIVVAGLMAFTRAKAHRLITNPVAERELPRMTPAQLQLPFNDVLITNADGLRLAGWYIPSRNRASILVQHGLKSCREEMLPAAAVLYRHGYGVLLCSVRAHDRSDGQQITFGIREVRDLEAWYRYLLTRPDVDPDRIGALGNSMGGSLVIQLAAQNPNIKAVAADSPFSSLDDTVATTVKHYTGLPAFPFAPLMGFWAKMETGCDLSQVNAKVWIRQLSPRPILLMQGGADTTVSRQSGERLFAAAAEPKELWYEPSIGHAKFATNMPAYEQRVVAFYDRALVQAAAPSAGKSVPTTLQQQITAAQSGGPAAQLRLALRFYNGEGVPRDFTNAFYWSRQAAEQGDAVGQFNLGVLYDRGEGIPCDKAMAVAWFSKSAQQGYAAAQFNLALMLSEGDGVLRDETQAAAWYLKAAQQGLSKAQCNLGNCYAEAIGVPKDEKEAVRWYRAAAEQGHPFAQQNLAAQYRKGLGVPQSLPESLKWLRQAAGQGWAGAQYDLGVHYFEGQGVEKSYAEAFHWFQLAADQGYPDAECNLGTMYDKGYGVKQDTAEGLTWIRRAVEHGDSTACLFLGNRYAEGRGVERDYLKAAEWYRRAAESGEVIAQANLAASYHRGLGVTRDDVEALKWALLTERAGSKEGANRCAELSSHLTAEEVAKARSQADSFKPLASKPMKNQVDRSLAPLPATSEP